MIPIAPSQGLCKLDQCLPRGMPFKRRECLRKAQALACLHELLRGAYGHRVPGQWDNWEEVRDRNVQHLGKDLKPRRRDPVGTLFVLLHLLKGQPHRLSECRLAHLQFEPAGSELGAHKQIDRFRTLL